MIKGFKEIREKLNKYDDRREALIKKARDLLKVSKLIIYSIHRDDLKEVAKNIKTAKKYKAELDKIACFDKKLIYEGSYSDACQEYAEAMTYYGFLKGKIPSFKDLGIDHSDYLMGICDLTGELGRRAVSLTTKKEFAKVKKIKDFVDDVYGEFLKFNLRNGNLRKKADSIKWNLKKLEEIMYDIGKR